MGNIIEENLKDTELSKISGGIATEITENNGKWKFSALWGSEVMSADFDTEEEAKEYEQEVRALSKVFSKRETPEAAHRHWLEKIYGKKSKSDPWAVYAASEFGKGGN